MKKGYLGLQYMQGVNYEGKYQLCREVAYAIDLRIEHNVTTDLRVSLSREFYGRLSKEVGYPVVWIEHLLGQCRVLIHENGPNVKVIS